MDDDPIKAQALIVHSPADGFKAFYLAEYEGQLRRAGLILGSPETAFDVVQEAFVAVWQRFDHLDNPGPYLNRCVLNGCLSVDRHRSVGERAIRKLQPLVEPPADPDDLFDAVAALEFNLRAPLVLRYYAELTNAEIAASLGWPVGSVGPRITRALRVLRKVLP